MPLPPARAANAHATTTTVKVSMILVCMVTFSWCWKQTSFADQIGAEVVFIPGWFDVASNDLTSYSIARRVLGRQR
jgi:hypothetical protein